MDKQILQTGQTSNENHSTLEPGLGNNSLNFYAKVGSSIQTHNQPKLLKANFPGMEIQLLKNPSDSVRIKYFKSLISFY